MEAAERARSVHGCGPVGESWMGRRIRCGAVCGVLVPSREQCVVVVVLYPAMSSFAILLRTPL